MAPSFSLVDHKLAEADFFLGQIPACGYNLFAVRCYVSAFASSTRSVTFALQSVLGDVADFKPWYEGRQVQLRKNPLARFFHEFRRVNQQTGDNLVGGGSSRADGRTLYWFTPKQEIPEVPSEDVETACTQYLRTVASLIYDCYLDFGPHIDGHQRYTAEFFERIGKTLGDAEEEIGFPRGWTDIGKPELIAYRWQLLRDNVAGCEVNYVFEKYLGKVVPSPERLPRLENEKQGWVYIPEAWRKTGDGQKDVDLILEDLDER